MNWSDLDAIEKTAAGGGVFGGLLILGIKAISFFRAERAGQASSDATTTQLNALRESVRLMSEEMGVLRAELNRMDRKVHVQQRTITRLEMVVRRLADLIEQNNITIPSVLREEMDDLIKDEPMNHRATDKPVAPQ